MTVAPHTRPEGPVPQTPAGGYEPAVHLRLDGPVAASACCRVGGDAAAAAEAAGRLTADQARVTCGACKRTPWFRR